MIGMLLFGNGVNECLDMDLYCQYNEQYLLKSQEEKPDILLYVLDSWKSLFCGIHSQI